MIKYIITGLPRSGTTWLSVFLTTDDCVCLHDPFASYTPDELAEWEGGVSDTALWYYDEWCKAHTDKFILIVRKEEDVISGLAEKGLPPVPDAFYDLFTQKTANKVIQFEDLFKEETLRDLWSYIYPDKPFNVTKWLQFKEIYMSPTIVERIYEESKSSSKL